MGSGKGEGDVSPNSEEDDGECGASTSSGVLWDCAEMQDHTATIRTDDPLDDETDTRPSQSGSSALPGRDRQGNVLAIIQNRTGTLETALAFAAGPSGNDLRESAIVIPG